MVFLFLTNQSFNNSNLEYLAQIFLGTNYLPMSWLILVKSRRRHLEVTVFYEVLGTGAPDFSEYRGKKQKQNTFFRPAVCCKDFIGGYSHSTGLPWWLSGKECTCYAGDADSIPGLGRSPGEGNGNPLQHSCLGNLWTEEPGGLQSTGSKRAGHDLATKQIV